MPAWHGFDIGKGEKEMIKKYFSVLLLLFSVFTLAACGSLQDTAEKNKELNEILPYFELDTTNYNEIAYQGRIYKITDVCLERTELQKEIGQVSKSLKNAGGKETRFGYVYRIEETDENDSVAVNINNEYRQADAVMNLP